MLLFDSRWTSWVEVSCVCYWFARVAALMRETFRWRFLPHLCQHDQDLKTVLFHVFVSCFSEQKVILKKYFLSLPTMFVQRTPATIIYTFHTNLELIRCWGRYIYHCLTSLSLRPRSKWRELHPGSGQIRKQLHQPGQPWPGDGLCQVLLPHQGAVRPAEEPGESSMSTLGL